MLLWVTENADKHRSTLQALLEKGIFTYVCPYETAAFYCDKKDIGGVILDCVSAIGLGERLCAQLRQSYTEKFPIAALLTENAQTSMLADSLIRTDGEPNQSILTFCRSCGWQTDPITLYHLTVGADPTQNRYMGQRLRISKSAHAILRCIAYRAPHPTSTDDLLSLCFPQKQASEKQLIATIREINRLAADIDPRPLIVCERGKGYRLRNGICDPSS